MGKQSKYKKILRITIRLTLILIWGNSIMPGNISGDISGGLMTFIKRIFGITTVEGNNTLHLIIRKIGHLSEFGVLGLQIAMFNYDTIKKYLSSIVLYGLFVALVDETIQLFVEGRCGQITDVWIDLIGYLVGISIIVIIRNVKSKTVK